MIDNFESIVQVECTMNTLAVLAIIGAFAGCCSNVVFLELLVKEDPGAGNLITFSQFFFIALEGFIFTSKCGSVPRRIPFKDYALLVAMFFMTSVCNNYAFDFNIPMPLHMIFRAGSLIANMLMGIMILRRTYKFSKYLSVLMITAGIILCTLVSGADVKDTSNPLLNDEPSDYSVFFWWLVGIGLLTAALLISACMGIYQEVIYKRHGKYPWEALYFTHLVPLPVFLFMSKNIWKHFVYCASSEPIQLSLLTSVGLQVPYMMVYLLANVITQFVCISSVYVLTTECSSLTVTLIVTLRKFVSLLFSILYFGNEFTALHWIGTLLVFIGTVIFTEIVPLITNSMNAKNNQLKKKQ